MFLAAADYRWNHFDLGQSKLKISEIELTPSFWMPKPAHHSQQSPFPFGPFAPGSQFFPRDFDFLLLLMGRENSFVSWPGNRDLVEIGVDAVAMSDYVIHGEPLNIKEKNALNRTMPYTKALIYHVYFNVLPQIIFLLVFERFSLAKYIIIHVNKVWHLP